MAKKKKMGIGTAVNVAYGLASQVGIVPEADQLYAMGKDALISGKNELNKKIKNDKIKQLLIEIGDRVISKKIIIDDEDIKGEVECIMELEEKIINKSK